jgi:hypothetical protein
MKYLSSDQRADVSDYPKLDFDGKRMLKEMEYQIFDNPSWTAAEREWFNTLRNNFLGCVQNYEMEAQLAYARGVEYANQQAAS